MVYAHNGKIILLVRIPAAGSKGSSAPGAESSGEGWECFLLRGPEDQSPFEVGNKQGVD